MSQIKNKQTNKKHPRHKHNKAMKKDYLLTCLV